MSEAVTLARGSRRHQRCRARVIGARRASGWVRSAYVQHIGILVSTVIIH